MLFVDFKENMYKLACFSVHQIYNWKPDFDSKNLTRWCAMNYIIKLRNGYYTFPEYIEVPGFDEYVANQIYRPSYISLHYALSHYGIIPEAIFNVTSVSSLKTINFKNSFGSFTYQKIMPNLMFGYEHKVFLDRAIQFACLEKAILDLFYLYPFYESEQDMIDLRADQKILKKSLNEILFFEYLDKFQNKQMDKRVNTFIKAYQL
jgi:predicted transcriptional regulator of viral defense system